MESVWSLVSLHSGEEEGLQGDAANTLSKAHLLNSTNRGLVTQDLELWASYVASTASSLLTFKKGRRLYL